MASACSGFQGPFTAVEGKSFFLVVGSVLFLFVDLLFQV